MGKWVRGDTFFSILTSLSLNIIQKYLCYCAVEMHSTSSKDEKGHPESCSYRPEQKDCICIFLRSHDVLHCSFERTCVCRGLLQHSQRQAPVKSVS